MVLLRLRRVANEETGLRADPRGPAGGHETQAVGVIERLADDVHQPRASGLGTDRDESTAGGGKVRQLVNLDRLRLGSGDKSELNAGTSIEEQFADLPPAGALDGRVEVFDREFANA